MERATKLLSRMVPISEFSRGGSARAFGRVEDGLPIIVMRSNSPIAVIVTVEDYERFTAAEERLAKLEPAEASTEA